MKAIGVILLQTLMISIIGGMVGILFGKWLANSRMLGQGALRFLRLGLWIPILIYPALPFWWFDNKYHYTYAALGVLILISAAAVGFSACYHYLHAVITLHLQSPNPQAYVRREIILQALLVTFFSQTWMGEYGWPAALFAESGGLAVGLAVITLILTVTLLVNWAIGADFDQIASIRAAIIVHELTDERPRSFLGGSVFAAIVIIMWQGLSSFVQDLNLDPASVVKTIYRLFVETPLLGQFDITVWHDVDLSLLEVITGLFLSGLIASLVAYGMGRITAFNRLVSPLLQLTYLAPLMIPVLLFYAGLLRLTRLTIASVGILSFFPFLRVLWSLRDMKGKQLFLAIDDALPFAFVGMLFGETMNAVGGLGFLMIRARGNYQATEAVAVFAVMAGILVLISTLLRFLSRYFYREILIRAKSRDGVE
jgi:ABC-type nitrate/sulfonate/bicarbonate transport system permease component